MTRGNREPEVTVLLVGEEYHLASCPRFPGGPTTEVTIKEAQKRGYKECRTCRAAGGTDLKTPDDDAATRTVYITRTGSKYHRSGCRYLSKSKAPLALKDAKRRGLTPCKVCKP